MTNHMTTQIYFLQTFYPFLANRFGLTALNLPVLVQCQSSRQTCSQTLSTTFLGDETYQLEAHFLWSGVWLWSGSVQSVYQL